MTSRILRTAALATLALASLASCGGDDKGEWQRLTPMPTPRTGVAVARVDGRIYVAGGVQADGSPTDVVEVYDPASNSWESSPPLPEPRHHAGAIGFGDLLIVTGGYGLGVDDPRDTVFEFDELTGEWSEASRLLRPRAAMAVVNLQGNSVVVGGVGKAENGSMEALGSAELRTNIGWHDFDRLMSVPRDRLAAASVPRNEGGHEVVEYLYAMGGREQLDVARPVETVEFSRFGGGWSAAAPLPKPRSGSAAAVGSDGRVYVFGGESAERIFDTVEAYDPKSDRWEAVSDMPTARHGHGAAAVGETIYVIGGTTSDGSVTGANEAFTP